MTLPSPSSGFQSSSPSGIWLPIVTPFKDGAVDFASYQRLLHHYLLAAVTLPADQRALRVSFDNDIERFKELKGG